MKMNEIFTSGKIVTCYFEKKKKAYNNKYHVTMEFINNTLQLNS